MKRILVVNVNWVGDVIFSTPVFKALKMNFPDSRISCVAVPRVKEILESCPFVDQVILLDEDKSWTGILARARLLWRLWRERFDVVFLLHRSWSRAFLVFLAGIPQRVGYDTKNRGALLTHKVELIDSSSIHRSDFYLQVIEDFGIKVEDPTCELAVSPMAKTEVEHLLSKAGIGDGERFVIVNTGGNWDLKRWPRENWALLVKKLSESWRCRVVIPGAAKDVEAAQQIAQISGVVPVILAGKTNLKQLIALMARASLVISADSGPMHIANCVGAPLVALFGPTRPEITGPRGKGKFIILQKDVNCNRAPCYNLGCTDNVCMKAVTVDDVMEAGRRLMGNC